ncbi:MAG: hypothetical protein PHX54_01370 [Lentimicrobiaceae bacterium]|nr:hypothetical protein [Lentimicrobiaceae bacterium]
MQNTLPRYNDDSYGWPAPLKAHYYDITYHRNCTCTENAWQRFGRKTATASFSYHAGGMSIGVLVSLWIIPLLY